MVISAVSVTKVTCLLSESSQTVGISASCFSLFLFSGLAVSAGSHVLVDLVVIDTPPPTHTYGAALFLALSGGVKNLKPELRVCDVISHQICFVPLLCIDFELTLQR